MPSTFKELLLTSQVVAAGEITHIAKSTKDQDNVTINITGAWRGVKLGQQSFSQDSLAQEDYTPLKNKEKIIVWGSYTNQGRLEVVNFCSSPLSTTAEALMALDLHFYGLHSSDSEQRKTKFKKIIDSIARLISEQNLSVAEVLMDSVQPEGLVEESRLLFQRARWYAKLEDFAVAGLKAEAAARLDPQLLEARFNLACYQSKAEHQGSAFKTIEGLIGEIKSKDAQIKKRFWGLIMKDADLASLRTTHEFVSAAGKWKKSLGLQ